MHIVTVYYYKNLRITIALAYLTTKRFAELFDIKGKKASKVQDFYVQMKVLWKKSPSDSISIHIVQTKKLEK